MGRPSPLLIALVVVIASCGVEVDDAAHTTSGPVEPPPTAACTAPGSMATCLLPSYPARPYDIYLPTGYEPGVPTPLVIAFHGGGGSSEAAARVTCPRGDLADAGCLHRLGEVEGFATVYPNGSGFFPFPNVRTWNAGGDGGEWNCTSGRACKEGIDDVGYTKALLEHLRSWLHVDERRIYAVGLSNGAAMGHRLACQLEHQLAAVAAIAGTNQFSATATCLPDRAVPMLQIHGTNDPCWTYETSDQACVDPGGAKLGVAQSTEGWVVHNGCILGPEQSLLPDLESDGTTTTRWRWYGCKDDSEVVLLRIEGGGHAWPNGYQYLPAARVGVVGRDWGNEVIWNFLSQFTLP